MFINLKLRGKLKFPPSFNTLVKEDFGATIELMNLVYNIMKKVFNVLDSFLSFMRKVVINNTKWWLRGCGDLLEGDEEKYQHGHMSLIVHTNPKEREYKWTGVEQLNMNAWHHRGCAKNVTLLETLRLHKQHIAHDHKFSYTFLWLWFLLLMEDEHFYVNKFTFFTHIHFC